MLPGALQATYLGQPNSPSTLLWQKPTSALSSPDLLGFRPARRVGFRLAPRLGHAGGGIKRRLWLDSRGRRVDKQVVAQRDSACWPGLRGGPRSVEFSPAAWLNPQFLREVFCASHQLRRGSAVLPRQPSYEQPAASASVLFDCGTNPEAGIEPLDRLVLLARTNLLAGS